MRRSAAFTVLVTACTAFHAQPLPSPVSRPVTPSGEFRAGFARVDITPPPGVGLAGSGPEGRRSTGYRTRLHAGALVMEDGSGERIALVVVDLTHVSANLHRLAAARLVDSLGLGADRLIISATHTHSGPGHFYGERQYNASASRVSGYDPRMTDLLVGGITDAVKRAAGARRRAVIAWGRKPVSGATWNRSLEAHCLNPEVKDSPSCRIRDSTSAVDTTLFMLRVDEIAGGGRDTTPLGSYSVFALHATALPSLNTLLDGDAQVRIVSRIAAHADRLAGRPTVHLFANGAEGDVAPLVAREQCDLPQPGLFDPVPAPRGPGELVDFIEPGSGRVRHCVSHALHQADTLATIVAERANALYDELGSRLHAAGSIRRAFTTDWLPGHDGLCGTAEIGTATAAGAEGLVTRVRGWRWLFPFIRLGIEEGNTAVDRRNHGCQAPKRTLLGPIQAIAVVGEHGFPETAQLTVVRIDSLVLGAVPAEVTTIAGHRMQDSMAAAARAAGGAVGESILIGLANGFLQYVTTREEYGWQAYEGGSDLYGPGTAEFLQRRLAELAGQLSPTSASPVAEVGPIIAYPGRATEIMAPRGAGDSIPISDRIQVRCHGDRLIAEWVDLRPGRILPRQTGLVRVEQRAGSSWETVAADGDGRLEVRALKPRGQRRFAWRAELPDATSGDSLRVVRVEDSESARRESASVLCHGHI